MKKCILLIAFLTLLSCNSDDNAAPPKADTSVESITGLWKVVSATADGYTFDFVDCDTPVDGIYPPIIGIYDFKANGNVALSSMCKPEDGIHYTTYHYENNVLSMLLYNDVEFGDDVEWKAKATALAGNRVMLEFYWNASDGDVSGNSVTIQKTTLQEIEAERE